MSWSFSIFTLKAIRELSVSFRTEPGWLQTAILRLEPTPGQWQPIPKVGKRSVDRSKNEISVKCTFPDSSINRKGF